MTIEISVQESEILLILISRGCSHAGAEMAQRGLDVVPGVMELLATATVLRERIIQAKSKSD